MRTESAAILLFLCAFASLRQDFLRISFNIQLSLERHDGEAQRRHCGWYVALFCALVQGCVTAPPEPAPAREPVVAAVPDGNWELVTSTFIGAGRIPGVARATLAFKDGRMSAFSGCNNASAAARLVDDWLEVGAMATTRRGVSRAARLVREPLFQAAGGAAGLPGRRRYVDARRRQPERTAAPRGREWRAGRALTARTVPCIMRSKVSVSRCPVSVSACSRFLFKAPRIFPT